MSEVHTPIPERERVADDKGLVSLVWRQFLNKIFGSIEARLQALEATTEEHEERIEALEP